MRECLQRFMALLVLQVVQVAVIVGKMYFVMPQMPDSIQDNVLEVWLQVGTHLAAEFAVMLACVACGPGRLNSRAQVLGHSPAAVAESQLHTHARAGAHPDSVSVPCPARPEHAVCLH